MLRLAPLSLILFVCAWSLACDGDSNTTDGTATPGQEPQSIPADVLLSPIPGESAEIPPIFGAAESSGTVEPVEEEAVAFVLLLNRALQETYKVTYLTTSPEGDEGDRYVIYNRPPLARIDLFARGSDEAMSLVASRGSGLTVNCTRSASDWQCFEIDFSLAPLLIENGPIVFPELREIRATDLRETDARIFAGQTARCFELTTAESPQQGTLEYCFSPEGVVLYSSASFGSVEAIDIDSQVSDGDFKLPVD